MSPIADAICEHYLQTSFPSDQKLLEVSLFFLPWQLQFNSLQVLELKDFIFIFFL